MQIPSLTATLMTKDSMATLPACLAALDFCAAIIVVDDFSTDGTWELLGQQGPRVQTFQRRLDSFAAQRQALHERVQTDWMLVVDADEEAMPGLAEDIAAVIAAPRHVVYRVPMKNLLPARWPRQAYYWNTQRRLLRTREVSWPSTSFVHAPARFVGTVGRLRHGLLHHSYDSTYQLWRKQLAYGRSSGGAMHAAGKRVGPVRMMAHAAVTFFKYYVWKGMARFGMGGLVAALAFACENIIKNATAWELAHTRGDPEEYKERLAVPLE